MKIVREKDKTEWMQKEDNIAADLRFVGTGGTGGPVKFFLTV